MRERLGPGDRRFVLACVGITLACGAVALRYFGRAFPEASIQFTVNRSQSEGVAIGFLAAAGGVPGGAKHAVVFHYDDDTKTYLERQLGLERAQDVYGHQVRLWRWSHRWFTPHQKEELRVDVTAGGDIAHFAHLLPEEAPGADIAPDSARGIAQRFVVDRLRVGLQGWDFVDGSSTRLPHRTDHTFTWKKRDLDLGDPDATYRMRVTVAGDVVSGYDEFLDIPQAWQDDYARLRARNDTAALAATLFVLLTAVAMIGVLVLRIRDHDVRWRTVVAFGIVAAGLQFLAALNQFDLEKFEYQTQDSYASFVTQSMLMNILAALGFGSAIALFTAAAEPVYRQRYPGKMALASFFTRRGVQTRSFFKEVLLGIALTTFFAAYQSVFYLVAARFGAWAPLEVPYSNMLNTAIPWALVLFIGFFPAVSEEFMSRMFSLPFFERLLGRAGLGRRGAWVAAALAASFIWGFAHSNYPNQPFWIRGVEVGVAGIVVCWVMHRWGILATLVWHYTVDAFYTALLMLRSGNPYFVLSGSLTAGLMVVPLAAALLLYWRRGGFAPEEGLRNVDVAVPPPAVPRPAAVAPGALLAAPGVGTSGAVAPVPPPARLPRRRLLLGAGIATALLLLFLVPVEPPGDGLGFETERRDALAAARDELRALGGDPDAWRVAIRVESRYTPMVGRYVLERAGLPYLNDLFASRMRTPVWRVRFWRPDEREEWLLNLPVDTPRDSLRAWAFEHAVPDSASGDTLGLDAAHLVASDFLRVRGIEPADLDLRESRSERQKARTDHTFEWQVPDSTLGEAGTRYLVVVRGGAVGAFRPYVHLPEAWLRAYEERSVLQWILWFLSRALLGALGVGLVVLFVGEVRSRRFQWPAALRWGTVVGLLAAVQMLLGWNSEVIWRYHAAYPYGLFVMSAAISVLLRFLVVGLLAAVLLGTLFAVRPAARRVLAGGPDRRSLNDALLLALVGVLLHLGVRRLAVVLTSLGAQHAHIRDLLVLPAAAQSLPWLDVYLGQLRNALWLLPVVALAVHVAVRHLGRRWTLAALGLAVIVWAGEGAHTMGEFGLQLALGLWGATALAFVFIHLFRGNDLAYLLAFVGGRGLGTVTTWLEQPDRTARSTGLVAAVLLLLTLLAVVWRASRTARTGATAPAHSGANT
jgi:membrane protease YdiL (CAAX protease family)